MLSDISEIKKYKSMIDAAIYVNFLNSCNVQFCISYDSDEITISTISSIKLFYNLLRKKIPY